LHSIPILGLLQTFNNGSKYKTKQLHTALQTSLGEDILFGGQREDDMRYIPKVAVTSTNEEGRKAVVIANYNRSITNPGTRKEAKSQCEFPRPDNPSLELRYWEAAAATAAAPPYFKSFYHQATKRSYLDGAFYNNNPARIAHQESKLLWPDVADHCPDIFLSIGTSKDSQQLDKESMNLGKAQRNKTTKLVAASQL
jgi:patatin-like phospholipase/acyl hydrolase